MIREVVHDPLLLGKKSEKATENDIYVADDLLDTLKANCDKCVGMAGNMIGERKCVIVFDNDGEYMEMFNPEIISSKDFFETEEGCLSLSGVRKTKRAKKIKVKWQNRKFEWRIKTFTGWTAQIIQHEIDHLNGILI